MTPLRLGACLSLSGRFARFGRQAATGLEVWRSLYPAEIELIIVDDRGDRSHLEVELTSSLRRCDLLLGPYSTLLTRAAARVAQDLDGLVWNHGGAGADVEASAPGHLVSVLAPTGRYAEPFVQLAARRAPATPLWLAEGRGSFGRQVIDGAVAVAERLGVDTRRVSSAEPERWEIDVPEWNLFCAGTFEEDVAAVNQLDALTYPPHLAGVVAAGVREFAGAVARAEGTYGIAQWAPGRQGDVLVGPSETAFLAEYRVRSAAPDYPAVQAAAAAALAVHCAQEAGSVRRDALWAAAAALRTTTLFGPFQIDPRSGEQIGHRPVLLRWTSNELTAVDREEL